MQNSELTPNSGSTQTLTKESVSDRFRQCLRETDALIKMQNLSGAKSKLNEAKILDPGNPYLGAFEARISALESSPPPPPSQQTSEPAKTSGFSKGISNPFGGTVASVRESFTDKLRKQVASETMPLTTPTLTKIDVKTLTIDDFSSKGARSVKELGQELLKKYHAQIATDRQKLEAETTALIEIERKRLQEEFSVMLSKQNEKVRSIRSEVKKEMENNFLRLLEQISKQYDRKMELLDIQVPQTKPDSLTLYKKKMRSYYANGLPSVDDAKKLMELKELLEITFDEHLSIESEIKEELYMFELRKRILQGEITLNSYSRIDELRQQYKLSTEQASRTESIIFTRIRKMDIKGRLLVVDPDAMHREILHTSFSDKGYEVTVVDDVQKAFDVLNTSFIDLILSDIKFPAGELEGFKFFSAVQEQFALRRIPFIVISGISDSMMYRYAAQLGVDDILMKPLDIDLLASVVEGKLKRYRVLAQV